VPTDHFGETVASRYDEHLAPMFEPAVLDATVTLLAELAAGGPALELGIGTGRVALPLTQRGVEVHGIDLSEAMVARLRAKPGGDAIPVVIGDFATTQVPGTFSLVYLVFNTVMNVASQDAQVACFENAARHLRPGGCFVIEVSVPGLQGLARGKRFDPFTVTDEHMGIDEYDVLHQGLVSHHFYRAEDGRYERTSVPFRYVWPAELDLMARLAGLRLESRWADWDRTPFSESSESHVSVWRLS
jgi:SAM-dependent methyltransferase